jgi:hypothetical protein
MLHSEYLSRSKYLAHAIERLGDLKSVVKMDRDMRIALLIVTVVLFAVSYVDKILRPKARGPPLVSSVVPLFGHFIGLFRHKNAYYSQIR